LGDAATAVERERLVAYLDLLGYQAVFKGEKFKGHDWDNINNYNDRAWLFVSLFYEQLENAFKPTIFGDLQVIGFSDAVFLVLTAEDDEGLEKAEVYLFCLRMQEFLDLCITKYLPIRGGISIGLVKARKDLGKSSLNYLAGLAVAQAVRMEAVQEWIGVSFVAPAQIEPEVRPRYCSLLEWLSSRNPSPIVRWDVPTKDGLAATYAIPCHRIRDAMDKTTESRDFEKTKKRSEANKYRGTLSLLRALRHGTSIGGDESDCAKL